MSTSSNTLTGELAATINQASGAASNNPRQLDDATLDMEVDQKVNRSLVVMQDFTKHLSSRGSVILEVPIKSLCNHPLQHPLNSKHSSTLAKDINMANLSPLFPMQGFTNYNWEKLMTLKDQDDVPEGLVAYIFDGGHHLAACRNLRDSMDKTWLVKLFPQGDLSFSCHFHY